MKSVRNTRAHNSDSMPGFLLGGDEVSRLLRGMDWAGSPLGQPHGWSPGLKAIMTTLLTAQAQIVLFWGPEYIALYNDAYGPSIGSKHPGALGRPGHEHWSELWDDLEPLLHGVRETGQTFSAKDRPFYIERKEQGETAYFDLSYSAVREADGSVGGVLCIVNETTERVLLQRRQAFLLELGQDLTGLGQAERIEAHTIRRLAEALGAARVYFGEDLGDGERFRIGHEWCEGLSPMLGAHPYAGFGATLHASLLAGQRVQHAYAAREARPKHLSGLSGTLHVPVLRAERLEAMLAVYFHSPRAISEDECQLVETTAKQAWAAITHARAERALHMLNENLEERVAGMLAQRETAMRQLHEARKLEMIGQLTGGIAHDLNNMLTPIIASLELLRRQPEPARAARLIDGGLQAAERARNLVGRLLSFARRQILMPQPVSLAFLVDDMHELIARSLGPTIVVQVRIDAELPTVMVDPNQLELAVLNLVINARDAMAAGGQLNIAAGLDHAGPDRPEGVPAGQVWLQVTDTGCGMSEDVLGHCTEPFYSTKGVGKGTGLGLPMVQGLALQSGGGFSITSSPDAGTSATVWLPVSDAPNPRPHKVLEQAPRPQGKLQVLLVDDEPLVRQATLLQLRELGCEVIEVDSAAQALAQLDQGLVPDVLLTDHVMADMTGVRCAQLARERLPDLPVLIITGYANLSPRELHGFEVLRKPFGQDELALSLASLLAARD
ncbi:ATP-binding protein [Pseudomonas sp. UFMG81]|uniref:ATP-binding protein n=1 Tax=Pseudomonas sp. UFMG81 TaxID=2745936 RepID=UPI00188F403B|nr:ATP-binding protein [Pseudomonas sp. UFMG81]